MSHETSLWVRTVISLVSIIISSIAIVISTRAKNRAEESLRQIQGTNMKGDFEILVGIQGTTKVDQA